MIAADPLPGVTAARLPVAGLAALAAVRALPGVRVHQADGGVWVTWPAGRGEVARHHVVGVYGAEFFIRRDGVWRRFGSRLPTSDHPPDGEGQSLAGVVVPGRFVPTPPPSDGLRLPVTLERGGPPRQATALVCPAVALQAWADTALTDELRAVTAARCGDRVMLRGRLPSVPGATRLWGADVLMPLGFRTKPDVPPATLRAAAGVTAGELLVLTPGRAEVVPKAVFAPATRAGLRLAGAG